MSERLSAEVCIIGAGPVGGTLACRLATAGIATVVVDRAALPPMEHPAFDGRAYAVAAGSRRLLAEAGVWDRLADLASPIFDIRISDGRLGRPASPLFLHFRHDSASVAAFGHMVEARNLRVALNAHMAPSGSVAAGAVTHASSAATLPIVPPKPAALVEPAAEAAPPAAAVPPKPAKGARHAGRSSHAQRRAH